MLGARSKTGKFFKLLSVNIGLNESVLNSLSKWRTDPFTIYDFFLQNSWQKYNKVECKTWALADEYGYLGQFEPNQDAKKGKMFVSSTKRILGQNVVLRLMKRLHLTVCSHMFMDNNFKSFRLLIQ